MDNYFTMAENYGNQIEHWNGVDVSVNIRPRGGVMLQGGLSTGRTTTDNCEVVAKVPESAPAGSSNSPLFCHVESAFRTQVKFLGTYTVPKVDVQVAATYQSLPGPDVLGTYNAPNSAVQPSLGRPLSGGAANVPVSLVEPGTTYGKQSNQVDLRFSKVFRLARARTALNLDLYNAFNASPILAQNNTYTATTWLVPQRILLARFAKISAQFDF